MSNGSEQDERPIGETRFDTEQADAIESTWHEDEAQGVRARKVIVCRDLVPGRDQQWILDNVTPQPIGTFVRLGTMAGYVIGVEKRSNMYKDKMLESVWLQGAFEAVSELTGEVFSAGFAILPASYGEQVYGAYMLAEKRGATNLQAELDVVIGLERIKPIGATTYEWVIYDYTEGPARKAIKAIRTRQQARLAREQQKRLADQSKSNTTTLR